MTEQEAIKELKHDCAELGKVVPRNTNDKEMVDTAYGMAVSALEKQIPKKIVIKNTKNKKLEKGIYVFYKCPECDEQIASGFYYPPHNEFLQEHKFCENCGQAIDWSE